MLLFISALSWSKQQQKIEFYIKNSKIIAYYTNISLLKKVHRFRCNYQKGWWLFLTKYEKPNNILGSENEEISQVVAACWQVDIST